MAGLILAARANLLCSAHSYRRLDAFIEARLLEEAVELRALAHADPRLLERVLLRVDALNRHARARVGHDMRDEALLCRV